MFISRRSPLEEQISVYLRWRARKGYNDNYSVWLRSFRNACNKDDVADLTSDDIDYFLSVVKETSGGSYLLIEARKAIDGLRRFYRARDRNAERIENIFYNEINMRARLHRNRELVKKRLEDVERWSFAKLGEYFHIHKTTAEEIFKRDVDKFRKELDI